MLEGSPGAGKTTAAWILADQGHRVIGEYTTPTGDTIPTANHPPVEDNHGHLTNWLTKHRQISHARRQGPVFSDRDWLSALAYAASLDDHGRLFATRTRWAADHLDRGALTVAHHYVILHADAADSLARRARRLTPGHPWSTPDGLRRLAVFYADPPAALHHTPLGTPLAAATWHHLHPDRPQDAVAFLDTLARRQPQLP